MAMAPEHQLLHDEEPQDARQHRRGGGRSVAAGDDGMRQHFEEGHSEQRADRLADQQRHPLRARPESEGGSGKNAQRAAGQ